jgi:hypothetical protein
MCTSTLADPELPHPLTYNGFSTGLRQFAAPFGTTQQGRGFQPVDFFADPCVFVYAGRSDRTCGPIRAVPQGWGTIAAQDRHTNARDTAPPTISSSSATIPTPWHHLHRFRCSSGWRHGGRRERRRNVCPGALLTEIRSLPTCSAGDVRTATVRVSTWTPRVVTTAVLASSSDE